MAPFQGAAFFKLVVAYDVYGNKTRTSVQAKSRDPFSQVFSSVPEERTSETRFDSRGRFVSSVSNVLGYTETYTYEPRFGNIASKTDINGLVTRYSYNEMGVKYQTKAPDGTSIKEYVYLCHLGFATCPSGAEYYRESEAFDINGRPMSGYSRSFYNKVGLKIVTAKETMGAGSGSRELITRINYDRNGRPTANYMPIFGTVNTVAPRKTETRYDLLGRVYQVIAPGSRVSTILHQGLTTTTTNAIGQVKTKTKNLNGDLLSVKDNAGNTITYHYDNRGQLQQVKDNQGQGAVITWDYAGHKTTMVDPDKGTWHYLHNGFGELVRQTDSRGVVITQEYDKLGRLIRRVDNATNIPTIAMQTSCWRYDSGMLTLAGSGAVSAALGLIHRVKLYNGDVSCDNPGAAVALQEKVNNYDHLARLDSTKHYIKQENSNLLDKFLTMQSYDEITGRVDLTILPEEVTVKNHYNALGELIKITDALDEAKVYRKINERDRFGNVVNETIGYGAAKTTTTRSYHQDTGYFNSMMVGKNPGDLVNFSVSFDKLGNAIKRDDSITNRREAFSYAESGAVNLLNRLTAYSVNGALAKSYRYNGQGNLISKSDIGNDYRYGGVNGGVHAVTTIYNNGQSKRRFNYDLNGNMIKDIDHLNSANNRSIHYSAFDKAVSIIKGKAQVDFRYGSDRKRYRRVDTMDKNGQPVTIETTYIGSYEKVVHSGGVMDGKTQHKYYIAGVAIKIDTETAGSPGKTSNIRYLHKDHLGSVMVISDEQGAALKRFNYDPFGKQHEITTLIPVTSVAVTELINLTERGFTGHEMLNTVDVIHMNGRIYDANIGRFIQADLIVQSLTNSQSFNRYSYVFNNPLRYTDPSGYSAWTKFRDKWLKPIVAIAISIYFPGSSAIFGSFAGGFGATVASGALAGVVTTGSLKGALTGAFAAGVFHGVGTAFGKPDFASLRHLGKVAAHGATGGVMSVLQGGKFGHGFASAGMAQFAAPGIDLIDAGTVGVSVQRVVAAAIVGGTTSAVTGGKFANGAVTGAFSRAFNDEMSHQARVSSVEKARSGLNWKKFESEMKRLSLMSSGEVFREAGFTNAQIQRYRLSNACATRVSLALNGAGGAITRGGFNPAGTRIITSVHRMNDYLTDTYGPADITWTGNGGKLVSKIGISNKGIVMYRDPTGGAALNRVTAWSPGATVAVDGWFNTSEQGKSMSFWSF